MLKISATVPSQEMDIWNKGQIFPLRRECWWTNTVHKETVPTRTGQGFLSLLAFLGGGASLEAPDLLGLCQVPPCAQSPLLWMLLGCFWLELTFTLWCPLSVSPSAWWAWLLRGLRYATGVGCFPLLQPECKNESHDVCVPWTLNCVSFCFPARWR